MKTLDPKQDSKIIKLPVKPKLRVLKCPPMTPDEVKLIDIYIAARRKEAAGKTAAEAVKSSVLQIVETRQQIARKGSLVSLDHSYKYHYSAATIVLEKALSEAREQERDQGIAKAVITPTVAFEDIRRKDREKREKLAKAG